jgi:hypothetical protein
MKSILQGLGIIFTLIASFLGNLYLLNGDMLISGFLSSIIVVILYFLQEMFIKKKSIISKNKFSTTSIVLWSIYVVLSIPITLSLIHSLNVELNEKKTIQLIASKKQENLNKMLDDYKASCNSYLISYQISVQNKLTTYKNNPNTALKTELLNPPFEAPASFFTGSISDPRRIAEDMKLNKSLRFMKLKDSIDERIKNYNKKYQNVFTNWSRVQLGIASVELNKLLTQNYTQLESGYKRLTTLDTPPFKFEYNKEEVSLNQPLALWNKYTPYSLLLIVILFHILILLPYIIEPVAGTYLSNINKNRTGGGISI